MKKIIVVLSLLFVVFFYTSSFYAQVPQADYTVSNTTELLSTKQLIRDRIKSGLTKNILVYLRGGTYQLTEPLLFTPQDSGNDQFSITYQAYPQEVPVISGGKQMGGWVSLGNNRWESAEIPEVKNGSWYFRDLYMDSRLQTRARFPNTSVGYASIDSVSPDFKTIKLYNSPVIPQNPLPVGAELTVLFEWSIYRGVIDSITGDTIVLRFPAGINGTINRSAIRGDQIYLDNAAAFLDTQGEWYLDRSTGKVLYYGTDPRNSTFIAPFLETLVSVKGEKNQPIKNLHFEGLTFSYSNWRQADPNYYFEVQAALYGKLDEPYVIYALPNAVHVEYTQNSSFFRNTLTHLSANGIGFGAGSRKNLIDRSEFADIGANPIMIGWRSTHIFNTDWSDVTDAPQENTITNNSIHDSGVSTPGAVGIWAGFSGKTTISHNDLFNLPYSGISAGYQWNTDVSSMKDTIISANHIHDVMKVMIDGGGIYTLGYQPNSRMQNNLIYNVARKRLTWLGASNNGIYLDGDTKGFEIASNIIFNVAEGRIFYTENTHPDYNVMGQNYSDVSPCNSTYPLPIASEAGSKPSWPGTFIPSCGSGQVMFPTITPGQISPPCFRKPQGDFNCDDKISLADFSEWRNQFKGVPPTNGIVADTNGDGKATLVEFNVWRDSFKKKL